MFSAAGMKERCPVGDGKSGKFEVSVISLLQLRNCPEYVVNAIV